MKQNNPTSSITNKNWLITLAGICFVLIGGIFLFDLFFQLPQFIKLPGFEGASFNTAIGLLCCGLVLSLIPLKHNSFSIRFIQILFFIAFALPLVDLIGRLAHFESIYPAYANWRMTAKAAVGILILATLVLLTWRRSPLKRAKLAFLPEQKIVYGSVYTLCLLIIAAGIASFALIQERMEKSLAQGRLTLLEERRDRLEAVLENQLQSAASIVVNSDLQSRFRSYQLGDTDHQHENALRAHLEILITQGFTGLALRDAEGKTAIQIGHFAVNPALAVYLNTPETTALLWNDGFSIRTEQILFDSRGMLGTLIAESPVLPLTQLVRASRGQGKTGLMEICARRASDIACFPQLVNHSAISLPLLDNEGRSLPIARALAGESGVIQNVDYRNHSVVEAFSPLNNYGLGISFKMDVDELYGPIIEQLPLAATLIVICIGLGIFTIVAQTAPLARQLAWSGTQANASNAALRDRLATTEAAQRQLRTITDHMPAAISYIDRTRCYRFNNQTFETWFGQSHLEINGRDIAKVTKPEIYEKISPCIEKAFNGERDSVELQLAQSDNSQRWVRNLYVPHLNSDGQVRGVYMMTYDITPDKLIEQQLTQMAQFDSLTGLPNRNYLYAKLSNALSNSRQFGLPLAIMFLDIDRFKEINDTFGHSAGDEVLKEFSQRLKISIRSTDTVARLAGDEFVIVLEGLHTPEEPQFIARKILAAVRKEFRIEGHSLLVTTSIGIAFCRNADLASADIIQKADEALYKAKAAGRDAFRIAV